MDEVTVRRIGKLTERYRAALAEYDSLVKREVWGKAYAAAKAKMEEAWLAMHLAVNRPSERSERSS